MPPMLKGADVLYIIYILAGWKALEIIIKTIKELRQAVRLYYHWKKAEIEKSKRIKIVR